MGWRYGMVRYAMVWYGTVRYGTVWYGTLWYGIVRYGTVRYGMVWYAMVRYTTLECGQEAHQAPRALASSTTSGPWWCHPTLHPSHHLSCPVSVSWILSKECMVSLLQHIIWSIPYQLHYVNIHGHSSDV